MASQVHLEVPYSEEVGGYPDSGWAVIIFLQV